MNRPFESWVVLGRTGGSFDEIRWEDLGLDPKRRHVVFEFWQRTYQAPDGAGFVPGEIPAKYHSQVFVIRERRDHPQVVATSHHLTGGGVDLLDVSWKEGVLSGRSAVVGGEPYEVFLTEDAGWRLAEMQCDGAVPLPPAREASLVRSGCRPELAGEIAWRARFEKVSR